MVAALIELQVADLFRVLADALLVAFVVAGVVGVVGIVINQNMVLARGPDHDLAVLVNERQLDQDLVPDYLDLMQAVKPAKNLFY